MYVVAIDASKDDLEGTDYKAFERCQDAKDRFFRAWAMIRRQKPVFEPGRPVHLYAARLYEVEASEPRTAIALAQRGMGTLILATEDPDPAIDLEELLPDLLVD
jgi:hypothetical protein